MRLNDELSQAIAQYKLTPDMVASVTDVPILLTVGITGAGKDTVLARLTAVHTDDYQFSVSHTTRPLRSNQGVMEQDGVEYYFIDKSAGLQMLRNKELIEANYFSFNLYGTSITEIKRAGASGKILITAVDVNGVSNFVRLGFNVKPVFILPPSFEVWQQRLHNRHEGTFNTEDLRWRLQTALAEIQNALEHDYFYIVINDDLDRAVELVNDIAHGKPVEARYPKAIELAKSLAASITAELQKLS